MNPLRTLLSIFPQPLHAFMSQGWFYVYISVGPDLEIRQPFHDSIFGTRQIGQPLQGRRISRVPTTTIKIRKGGSFKSGWEGGDIHQSSLVGKWKPQISHSNHGNRKFKKRHAVSLWLSAPTGKQPIKDGDNKFMWKSLVLKVSIWKHRRHRIIVQHAKSDLVSFKIKIVYTINVHVIHWILHVLLVCSHLKEKRPQLPKLLPRNTSMKHGSLKSLLKSRRSEEVVLSRQSISSIIPHRNQSSNGSSMAVSRRCEGPQWIRQVLPSSSKRHCKPHPTNLNVPNVRGQSDVPAENWHCPRRTCCLTIDTNDSHGHAAT